MHIAVSIMAFVNSANARIQPKPKTQYIEAHSQVKPHTFDTEKAWYPENAFCAKQNNLLW